MKINRYLILLFIVQAIATIESCEQKQDKIGMLIASSVFEPNLKYFSDKVSELGYVSLSANANYDDKLQISQAQELIDKGVKILVIIPVNTYTAAVIVRLANSKNVKIIAFERIISNCKLDYFISFDNVIIGEMLAAEALRIKPKGNYFILNGDISDQNAVWVREGFYKALEPSIKSGQVKVVFDSYIEDWMTENATHELKRYVNLTGNIPDVILSAYSGMNIGLFNFFDKEKITNIPLVAGQDIDTKEARTAKNVNQKIALYKSPKIEADAAAELAVKLMKNQSVKIEQVVNNGLIDVNSILVKEMKIESN